jgi:alpha-2-macroglobulin
VSVDYEVRARSVGTAVFTATVACKVESDAMETSIPVVAFGANVLWTEGGVLREAASTESRTIGFTLPDEMNTENPVLEVHVNPTIAGVLIDAIPYLAGFPYGCTEQTMSRFVPAVVVRDTLNDMGLDLRDLKALAGDASAGAGSGRRTNNPVFSDAILDDMIRSGVDKLKGMQNADGGWGWFDGVASEDYMTAHVVQGLAEARDAGATVDESMIERGVAYVQAALMPQRNSGGDRRRGGQSKADGRAWLLFALATADPKSLVTAHVRTAIDDTFVGRDDLTDYTRAMLAIVLDVAGEHDRARLVLQNFENTVVENTVANTAHWGRSAGYRYWRDNAVEATAMVLRAMLRLSPDDPRVIQAVNWLVSRRTGDRWYSTKETAFVVRALADYLAFSGELSADMTIGVTIDGRAKRTFRVTPDNVLTSDYRLIFAPRHLRPGAHSIQIDKTGTGNVYYGVYLDYYSKQDAISAEGDTVRLSRTYHRMIPKTVTRSRRVWDAASGNVVNEDYEAIDYDRYPVGEGDTLTSGDLIEVSLEITSDAAIEYVIVEDPKPAGCEPFDLHSGHRYSNHLVSRTEYHDQHVVSFIGYLPEGTHVIRYRLRCETAGTFGVLPAELRAMYSPYVRSNSASRALIIAP